MLLVNYKSIFLLRLQEKMDPKIIEKKKKIYLLTKYQQDTFLFYFLIGHR